MLHVYLSVIIPGSFDILLCPNAGEVALDTSKSEYSYICSQDGDLQHVSCDLDYGPTFCCVLWQGKLHSSPSIPEHRYIP